MWQKWLRSYRLRRFTKNPTRGHFVPLRQKDVQHITTSAGDVMNPWYVFFNDDVQEFFDKCGPHYHSIIDTHGKLYFFDEIDAVQFKLAFL